jgi:hypothetical protein
MLNPTLHNSERRLLVRLSRLFCHYCDQFNQRGRDVAFQRRAPPRTRTFRIPMEEKFNEPEPSQSRHLISAIIHGQLNHVQPGKDTRRIFRCYLPGRPRLCAWELLAWLGRLILSTCPSEEPRTIYRSSISDVSIWGPFVGERICRISDNGP